jgi:hypothetical protein
VTYESRRFGPFSGLNQDENPYALRDDELQKATNAARRGSLVGTRPGAANLGTGEDYEAQLTGAPCIQGAAEYRSNYDQNRVILVIAHNATATQKIWHEDAAQLPAGPTLTTNKDYIWSFALFNDLLWGTGGPAGRDSATTEPMWTWDGNTASAATARTLTDKATGATLYPKFIKEWRGYLIIGGLQQSSGNRNSSNNPVVARYCTFSTDPTDDVNWLDGNTIGYRTGGSGPFSRIGLPQWGAAATGFGEYQDNKGDFLCLLSNKGIVSCVLHPENDFAVTDSIPNGCVHQRAFVNLGLDTGDAIYVSEHGVHSLRQSQQHGSKEDSFLSWKIREFWNTINRARIWMTCGAYDRANGRVVFVFSTGSETKHNYLWCLDVKDQQSFDARTSRWFGPWTIRDTTLGDSVVRVNHIDYMRNASNEWKLYLFTDHGYVLQFDEDVYQDLGSYGYSCVLRTKDFDFGNPNMDKRVGDCIVSVAPGGNHNVTFKTHFDLGRKTSLSILRQKASDGGVVGTGTVGSAKVGSGFAIGEDKVYQVGKGRTVGWEISHATALEPFLIGAITTEVSGAGESKGDIE